jgi:hypothetical protein
MMKRRIGRIVGVLTLTGAAVFFSAGTAQACPAWGIETGINAASAHDALREVPKFMLCDEGE